MSTMDILKDFAEAVKATGGQTTKPYDTPATVIRVEGDIVWVHIPGGVDETPVRHTIAAKPGDVVQIRVSGGSACIVGNETAPPTDDTKAEQAIKKAEEAGGTASNFVTDTKDGIFVHPKNNKDDGVRITDAIEIIKGGLSFFKAWVEEGLGKVRVGRADEGHTDIDSYGMKVYGGDGTKQLAHIGCSLTTLPDQTVVPSPHYDFGVRTGRKASYSMTVGWNDVEASEDTAFAIGQDVHATHTGAYAGGVNVQNDAYLGFAHGQDLELTNSNVGSAVFGHNNFDDSTALFTVGNGTEERPKNAFMISEDGTVLVDDNQYPVLYKSVSVTITYAAGTIGTRGAAESLGSTTLTGYTYMGAEIMDHQNTSLFSVYVGRNDTQKTAYVAATRCSGNAVTGATVKVRMKWVNNHLVHTV